jgi:CDP-diacylglycerol--serine O-phosphatidyltransferase
MVTLAALFASVYAIIMAFNRHVELAVIGIFVAAVLDGLDGRIARMTNTQSAFGEQMDSLADMVSFGAAPALISYIWVLKDVGRWGWIAVFVYVACAALRLARFNVNTSVVDRRYFQGLPSPAAAALVMGFIWLVEYGYFLPRSDEWTRWAMFVIVMFAGLTMVTNAPFYSFKELHVKKTVPFAVLILAVIFISTAAYNPQVAIFSIFLLYGLSGYGLYAWRRFRGESASVISTSTSDPEERGLHEE